MQRPRFLRSLLALFGAPWLSAARADARNAFADLIVIGATIHSVDDANASPEAFAVRGGRFVLVGSIAAVTKLRGPQTRVLELSGKTVLPGLIDAHLHLTQLGLSLHELRLFGVRSFEELIRATVAFAKASPDRWIDGDGWDQDLWPGEAFPRMKHSAPRCRTGRSRSSASTVTRCSSTLRRCDWPG
ncbi:MAG TPA: amidohydrolase family protein [Candidatus Cybelea sp.]